MKFGDTGGCAGGLTSSSCFGERFVNCEHGITHGLGERDIVIKFIASPCVTRHRFHRILLRLTGGSVEFISLNP